MKKQHMAAIFLIGLLAGCFAGPCLMILQKRWPNVGGEAVVLPLIGLLVWFGYQMGSSYKEMCWLQGYEAGYKAAQDKTAVGAQSKT